MLFIIWDPKDGAPRRDDDGTLISDGILGRIGPNNVYLTAYAQYPDKETRRPCDLQVGEWIKGVRWHLSGEYGIYDIHRVA